MSMRDYDELENVKIPAEQERIMDIICDAWEECRASDCPCDNDNDLPSKHSIFACTSLKYAKKIHEAGYTPATWIDVNDRLPEPETEVLVCARYCGLGNKVPPIISTAMYEDGAFTEKDSRYFWYDLYVYGTYDEEEDCYRIPQGWYEFNHFSNGSDCMCMIDEKVTHWMPLPDPPDVEHGSK